MGGIFEEIRLRSTREMAGFRGFVGPSTAHSGRPAVFPKKLAALKPPFHNPHDPNQALTATRSGEVAATAPGLGVVWPFISVTGGGITASA